MSAQTLALRILAGVAVVVVLAVVVGSTLFSRTDKTASTVDRNREQIVSNQDAIMQSCELLRDLFLHLGGASSRQSNEPPSKAQQLAELRLSVLERLMTPVERRENRRLRSFLASHGGVVTAPDCERIARP